MEFDLISHNVSGMTGQLHTPDHQNLIIRVDGHTLPEITLSNSDMHHEMLSNVLTHNMISKNGAPGVYLLDPEKLISQGNSVELVSSAVIATRHGFKVAKTLEAARVLVKKAYQRNKQLGRADSAVRTLSKIDSGPDPVKVRSGPARTCRDLH